MRRETKYTLTGFAVFLYSQGLMALFMMSFFAPAGPENKMFASALTLAAGSFSAYLVHAHPKGLRFRYRAIVLFLGVTLAVLMIWLMVCEGTFRPLT